MIVDCIEREESELNANVVIFSIQTAHWLNVRFNKFGLFILMRLSVRSQLKTFSVITGEISRHFSVNRIELNGTKQIDLFGWTFGWHTRMVTSVNILLSWNKTIDNFIVWRQHNMCTKHMKRATEDEYNSIRFDWIVNLVISAFYRTITKMILLFILRFFSLLLCFHLFPPFFFGHSNLKIDLYNAVCKANICVRLCVGEQDEHTKDFYILFCKNRVLRFSMNVQCHECSSSNNQCSFIWWPRSSPSIDGAIVAAAALAYFPITIQINSHKLFTIHALHISPLFSRALTIESTYKVTKWMNERTIE